MRGWVLTVLLALVGCNGGDDGASSQGAAAHGSGGTAGIASGDTPFCGEPCEAPAGCYPCAEGSELSVDGISYQCTGGCWTDTAPEGPTCQFFGRTFGAGQSVPAADGCNECTCVADEGKSTAAVACTTKACSCDGLTGIDYRTRDAALCEGLDFDCPANTEKVFTGCGCGCRQNPECADRYSCTQACDRDVIAAFCPYSTIEE